MSSYFIQSRVSLAQTKNVFEKEYAMKQKKAKLSFIYTKIFLCSHFYIEAVHHIAQQ